MIEPDGLHIWPHPVLNKRAVKVDFGPDRDPRRDLLPMIERMQHVVETRSGLGLAANQIGALHRVIVVRLIGEGVPHGLVPLVNPKIVMRLGKIRWTEACLSLPGISVPVVRDESVLVEFTSIDGHKGFAYDLSGQDAVVVQHEIDHLDGKTLADHPNVRRYGNNAEVLDALRAKAPR